MSEIIGSLADYFTIDLPSSDDTRDAYFYAYGLFLVSFITVLFTPSTIMHHTCLACLQELQ